MANFGGSYGGSPPQFNQPSYQGNYGGAAPPYPQQGDSMNGGYGCGFGGGGGGGYGQKGMGGPPQGFGCGGPGMAQNGFNQGGYDNGYGYDGDDYEEDGYGWRQEYSVGNGPEYQAESLWTQEADEELAEIHVFGPPGVQIPPAVLSFDVAAQIFPSAVVSKLQGAGFTKPTPIQAHTWAIGAAGRDLIGIAKTGSGKTLAFLVPGFLKILNTYGTRPPLLCILAPTRELACQIEAEADKFGRPSGIRTACCYGGAPRGQQLGALRRGAQIVVACPGRLNDFIVSGAVNLSNVTYLVLDEADRMLDMGFEPQIRQVIGQIPAEHRQTLLFTATWPREVRSLASEFLKQPIHVQTGTVNEMTVNKDIEQRVVFVSTETEKAQQLLQILHSLGANDRCLIFCEMKRSCEMLANALMQQYGVPAVRIHGDLAQWERSAALEAFKNGQSPIMCATDVAARGIDVKGVTVVINYDASSSAKDYVHRIGRTGRAGAKGTAYSILLHKEDKKAQEIVMVLQRSGLPIPPELEPYVKTRGGGRKGGKGKGKGKGRGKGGGKGKGGGFKGGK